MNQFPARGVRERISGITEHVGFLRAQRAFLRTRMSDLNRVPAPPGIALDSARPVHVVVVPQEGMAFESFAPGNRNLYFEAAQSLRDILGASAVSEFHAAPGKTPEMWHSRLIDFVHSVKATHLLGHVESDPGQVGPSWTWDVLWQRLSRQWDGVLLGVMFDSSYPWLSAQSRLLARISDHFLLVDICMPMNGRMVRGRPEVGPVNMPMSHQSLELLDNQLADITPEVDVSFIGAMYPYRMQLVEKIRSLGVSVAVNPHRSSPAEDFSSSRSNQPSWLDYMAGLASSRMTLNFSQSSAGRFEQLKTRVLEATLAGTMLLTDDTDRTSRFFIPGVEFAYFRNVDELPSVIARYLAEPESIASIAAAGSVKARQIAPTGFWHAIDEGLRVRGLRSLNTS